MPGTHAPNPARVPAIRAHVAQLRQQRDTLQAVIETLEENLYPPVPPVTAPAPAPRPTLAFFQILDSHKAA